MSSPLSHALANVLADGPPRASDDASLRVSPVESSPPSASAGGAPARPRGSSLQAVDATVTMEGVADAAAEAMTAAAVVAAGSLLEADDSPAVAPPCMNESPPRGLSVSLPVSMSAPLLRVETGLAP